MPYYSGTGGSKGKPWLDCLLHDDPVVCVTGSYSPDALPVAQPSTASNPQRRCLIKAKFHYAT